eukprot:CAMPEP_0206538910 /NCGR_PEP_ID=MMETSP0325_2-20121206/8143_1 /ASSEMBLY_ACC=CAM_ASM_000347 /TAXON_ID=2866 /ORGANISM="Crypthecodinium cohnii, Strain Seligo" /LENGTH=117 /DNA_ID=CAMNT_0054036437 /DNA_START=235 /DNA_END=587 /DNA_ORIENTATION=+
MPAMNSIRSLHGRVLGSPCAVSDVWFLIAAESGGLDPMLATQRWEAWTPPLALLYDVNCTSPAACWHPSPTTSKLPTCDTTGNFSQPSSFEKVQRDGVGWGGMGWGIRCFVALMIFL